jgi:hypothetical protein
MPTNRIPRKLFDYHPKGRREIGHQRDGRINSSNPKIGTKCLNLAVNNDGFVYGRKEISADHFDVVSAVRETVCYTYGS